MNWIIARVIKYGLTKITEVIVMETIKAFLKTRKGKGILISLILGLTGISLPPEAIEAAITLVTALGV